jgi:hypothetical protein
MSNIEEKIRRRAHDLWEAAGRPEGRDEENWMEAERQIMAEEGEGEPTRGQPQLAPNERPEPQPEVPVDPTGGVEGTRSRGGPEMPAGRDKPEMPGTTAPEPEIPAAEPGISEVPAAPLGVAAAAGKRGKKKSVASSGDLAGAGAAGAKVASGKTGKGRTSRSQA